MGLAIGWVISALGAVASLLWLGQLLAVVRRRKARHWLADLADAAPEGGWPGLTVIFAARDEATDVEAATRSILAQDYPALEVVAVDDRSTDATGAILDGLEGDDRRLRVVHVRELPTGWLGKTHALHTAAAAATSRWLLFTDADVAFAPGALRRAVAWAEGDRADHLTVVPEFVTAGVGERLFLVLFNLGFACRVLGGRIEAPGGRTHLGIGAFNLVRLGALRGIGGFDRLRLSVDDDNRLAQALRVAGYRGRAVLGVGAVSVRWQVGVAGLIRGPEKNYFSFFDFRVRLVAVVCLAGLALGVTPFAGLFVGPLWARAGCAGGVVALAALLAAIRRQTGTAWYYALAFPLTTALVLFALIRSTWLTLRHGGVRWRGSSYPLSELRAHIRLRNAWLREVRPPAG
jgi:hypothetical protein